MRGSGPLRGRLRAFLVYRVWEGDRGGSGLVLCEAVRGCVRQRARACDWLAWTAGLARYGFGFVGRLVKWRD
jgi:hypothetical protein